MPTAHLSQQPLQCEQGTGLTCAGSETAASGASLTELGRLDKLLFAAASSLCSFSNWAFPSRSALFNRFDNAAYTAASDSVAAMLMH